MKHPVNHGVILVDKPRGVSSAQAVARVKRALKPDRIGHAGTLDPPATGLLICMIGQATRLAQYAEGGKKIYSGVMRFGVTTGTDDMDGEILSEQKVSFSEEQLLESAKKFIGAIEQLPPRVSAIKVDGVRAYDLARRNEAVELKKRPVVIDELTLKFLPPNRAEYIVRCSKGTYIRSIARDIGELLGCGGAIETLRRVGSEPFTVDEATSLDEVSPDVILPWQRLFPGKPFLELAARDVAALAGGDQRCLAAPAIIAAAATVGPDSSLLLYGEVSSGAPAGILLQRNGTLQLGVHLPS